MEKALIRVTTLGLITPYTKDLETLDELLAHLEVIGYIRRHLMNHDVLRPADNVTLRAVEHIGTPCLAVYMFKQLMPDDTPRQHLVEFDDPNEPAWFEDRMKGMEMPHDSDG